MNQNAFFQCALMALFVALAGCASTSETVPTQEPVEVDDPTGSGAETGAIVGGSSLSRRQYGPDAPPGSPLAQRAIYFDYDAATVKAEYRPVVEAHGTYLSENPRIRLVLEGNADERGTREYNIALGERRAHAVRRIMLYQGAAPEQIRIVSYGEERPVSAGSGDSAWAQNRRVEIVYAGDE
jgi:peptidoglycan-associated lipoprotein